MDGIVALLLSKKFTKDTVIGMGAIKGAACQVQSINKAGKTTTITLKWEDNVGGVHTQAFDIEDGADGVSVTGATINASGHLILTLSNTNTIDCGQVLPQYDTMPTPSATNEGQILQYIGTTTSSFTNGYFYICESDGVGGYHWVQKLVQDSYTKVQIGDISDLPDNTKNVIENIGVLKLSIDQLSASKLSISDIDNALSNTSENPVQNKVIKLTIDQLKGSILDKLNEKENKFRYSIMPIASVDNIDQIVEYIGATDTNYTNGYFYQCRFDGTNYEWIQKNIQPSGGSTGGDGVVDGYYNSADQLFYEENTFINPITGDNNTIYVSLDTNLLYRYNGLIFIRVDESSSGEDDVINGYYNTTDGKFYEDSTYTTEIVGQTGKIYISIDTNIQYRWDNISVPNKFVTISSSIDVDNALSITSENPVQNKVITAKIDDLDALMATKLSTSDIDNVLSDVSENPVQNKVITLELNNLKGTVLKKSDVDNVLSTTSENPVQNKVVTAAIQDLQASKLSIVDVDNALSATSLNPVQNKVIALELDALKSSVLTKIQKKLAAQEDNFAVFTNDGDIKDSGISKDVVPATVSISNKLLVASDLSTYQEKLTEGNGIDIDTNNKISVDISYLTASTLGYIPNTEKGSANGVAELDTHGKVPSSQLPSYVDDVIDGYYYDDTHFYKEAGMSGYYNISDNQFYKDSTFTELITPVLNNYYLDIPTGDTYQWDGSAYISGTPTRIVGEDGVIYISVDSNIQYRWTGMAFAALGGALQLGETSTTAYRGDRGKIAYDHSQITDGSNPHNTTADNVNLKVPISALSGTKLDVESTLYGINTELGKKQPKELAVPISMLSGTKLYVEETLNALNDEKADKVSGATNGHLAGLDANGNLTDSGVVANDVYVTTDTAETNIDDADYFPFYDTSATAKKKTLWSNIKEKIKAYFDSIYATIGLLKDTVGWTGKNLNGTKYPASVIDRYGIDWTYNSETGIITANGTSTDKSTFGADSKYSFTAPYSAQVILSGCSNADSNVHIYAYDTTTSSRPYKDSTKTSIQNANVYNGEEVSFYMEAGHNYIMPCRINATGITVSEFKFYPMLRKAEISDPTFEPPHKDVVDTLREAEVVEGKNIIPFPYYSQIDGNKAGTIEPTVNRDGSITFSAGTSSAGSKYYYLISRFDSHFTVPAGRYWCSGIPSDTPAGITMLFGCTRNGEGYSYNTLSAGEAKVGNVKAGDELGLTIIIDPNTTISSPITFYPMICSEADWNKSHDYEPSYIPVKDAMLRRTEQRILGAKNLYDTNAASKTDAYGGVWTVNDDKTITVSGTPTDYEPFSTRSYYVLPAGEYIINWNEENLVNVALDSFRLCKGNTEVRVVATNKASAFSFTITNSDDYDNIRIAFKRVTNNVAMSGIIKPMIRFASDPDDTYVPYAMTNAELTKCVTWKDV